MIFIVGPFHTDTSKESQPVGIEDRMNWTKGDAEIATPAQLYLSTTYTLPLSPETAPRTSHS